MTVVNIAELKNHLSAYLKRVRAGEEVLIRDRNLPIARLVPMPDRELSAETLALVAEGKMRLATEKLDESFWRIGEGRFVSNDVVEAGIRAIIEDREDRC